MREIVLEVENVCKTYNKKVFAINDISFSVEAGEIVGLLGKNGAGKSTIIKSITGVLPFEKGNISILNYDIEKDALMAKKYLGYVPDVSNAFDKMTGMEYLNFVADIFDIDKEQRKQKVELFQKHFELGESIHKLISSYSHGMKQKISIMASLMSSPKLWILDEPITGLDHQTQLKLIDFIRDYANNGNAILFSSHDLGIVQKICNRVIIIDYGKKIADLNINDINKGNYDLSDFYLEKVK